MALVACIPNFSEGRDRSVIDAIAASAREVEDARVIHIDAGVDANRTVMTIVGMPEAVSEAAFRAIKTATDLIDMTKQAGAHPRIGATDVVPFVPLAGSSIETCIALAQSLADRISRKLRVATYLYGRAALRPQRMDLKVVRRGQYEGLAQRINTAEHQPDFGSKRFNAKSGATAVGARDWLIAYNVNIESTDLALAKDIAKVIRSVGAGGVGGFTAGGPSLPGVKAIGWSTPAYNCVQVSMNLVNFRLTPPHIAYSAVMAQAEGRGLSLRGSELVGMIPLSALVAAGIYYLEQAGASADLDERMIVAAAAEWLGLDAVRPFDPDNQVLEYRLRAEGGIWAEAASEYVVR